MKMLIPHELTDANIISSNLAENDYPEWDAATNYSQGDRVMVAAIHKTYEAINANQGADPATSTSNWLELGATNKWRSFDQFIAGPATNSNEISYEIQPDGYTNAVAFFGLDAAEIQIVITTPNDGEVYNETFDLISGQNISDWQPYFFAPIETMPQMVVAKLPEYAGSVIEIFIRNTGGIASVGQIVIGNEHNLGTTTTGTSISFDDYSRKDRDQFGRATIVERNFADKTDFDFVIPNGAAAQTRKLISQRRAKATVFYADADRPELGTLVYGMPSSFDVVFSTTTISNVTLEVEGLV